MAHLLLDQNVSGFSLAVCPLFLLVKQFQSTDLVVLLLAVDLVLWDECHHLSELLICLTLSFCCVRLSIFDFSRAFPQWQLISFCFLASVEASCCLDLLHSQFACPIHSSFACCCSSVLHSVPFLLL